LHFVRRKTLHAPVSSALVVGAINLGLILILSGLALGHLRVENLLYVHVPFLGGHPFEPALLGLIFGVIFASYFGHFSVNSCARSVLQRDPSGRSLALGCMAAQASAMLLYILWVVAVNGAIAPRVLAGFSGTALTPLVQLAGPAVNVFGVLLAILAMGMASIHLSLALFFTVREWIPGQSRHTLLLGRRQGKLIFTPRGKAKVSLALTYLGLKAGATQSPGLRPQFRLDLLLEGDTRRFEVEVHETWEAATTLLAAPVPKLPSQSIQLAVKIVTASADMVRVQLVTSIQPQEGRTCARVRFAVSGASPGSREYLPGGCEHPVPAWALYLAERFPKGGGDTRWGSYPGNDLLHGAQGRVCSPPGDRGSARRVSGARAKQRYVYGDGQWEAGNASAGRAGLCRWRAPVPGGQWRYPGIP
jgi:hypothetical protein